MVTTLEIKSRENKKPQAIRREGSIPATMYGPEIDATSIQLNAKEFSRIPFEEYTRLIRLKDSSAEHEVLIKNIQRDFMTREVLNIEFYKVMKGHKLNAKVAFKFVGASEAVKLGADFVVTHKEAHIRCLPRHIPYSIEIDISKLQKPDDHITFADLNINRDEIEILDPAAEIICKAEISKKDHTIETAAPAAAADAVPATSQAAPAADAKAKA